MIKHTPGPWVLENRGYKFIVYKPGDGYITRDICRLDSSTMSAFAQEANAHLIVAAPDLLKALKMSRSMLLAHGERHVMIDYAIAKAEGNNDRQRIV